MYTKYWNLARRPFELGPDTAFHYPAAETLSTYQKLRYLLETRRSSVLLTGVPGVGKTHLARLLAESGTPKRFCPVFYQSAAAMDAENFLFYLAHQAAETRLADSASTDGTFRPESTNDEEPSQYQAFLTIERTVLAAHRQRKRPLLIVEDTDRVHDPQFWDLMKALLDQTTRFEPALSLFLIGESVPADSGFSRFEPYLETKGGVHPFQLEETADYVLTRLALAHSDSEIFTPEALETVFQYTGGVARAINRLCDMALLIGSVEKLEKIDDATVEALHRELFADTIPAE